MDAEIAQRRIYRIELDPGEIGPVIRALQDAVREMYKDEEPPLSSTCQRLAKRLTELRGY